MNNKICLLLVFLSVFFFLVSAGGSWCDWQEKRLICILLVFLVLLIPLFIFPFYFEAFQDSVMSLVFYVQNDVAKLRPHFYSC